MIICLNQGSYLFITSDHFNLSHIEVPSGSVDKISIHSGNGLASNKWPYSVTPYDNTTWQWVHACVSWIYGSVKRVIMNHYWFVDCLMPSCSLNQCWLLSLTGLFGTNVGKKKIFAENFFFNENAFSTVFCKMPGYSSLSMLIRSEMYDLTWQQ